MNWPKAGGTLARVAVVMSYTGHALTTVDRAVLIAPSYRRSSGGLPPQAGPEAPSAAAAPQAATPRLRPPAHDTDAAQRLDPAHSGSHRAAGQVTEHVYLARTYPACRRRCTPPAVLDGVVLGQQRLGVNLLNRHAAGRGAAAHPQRPVVSGHRASVAPQRGGHRERHSPAPRTQPAVAAIGPHAPAQWSTPTKPAGAIRVDFQHPHRTLLPAAGSGQSECFLRSIGQRFLRRLPPL